MFQSEAADCDVRSRQRTRLSRRAAAIVISLASDAIITLAPYYTPSSSRYNKCCGVLIKHEFPEIYLKKSDKLSNNLTGFQNIFYTWYDFTYMYINFSEK